MHLEKSDQVGSLRTDSAGWLTKVPLAWTLESLTQAYTAETWTVGKTAASVGHSAMLDFGFQVVILLWPQRIQH